MSSRANDPERTREQIERDKMQQIRDTWNLIMRDLLNERR